MPDGAAPRVVAFRSGRTWGRCFTGGRLRDSGTTTQGVRMRAMRLEPGAKFDRYVIEALLGKGGMGHVYRAFDARLERSVALKILEARAGDEDCGPEVWNRRILREARAAAALAHPNTVAV